MFAELFNRLIHIYIYTLQCCYYAINVYRMINRSIFFADRLSRSDRFTHTHTYTHTLNKSVYQPSDGAMTGQKNIIILSAMLLCVPESSIEFAVSSKVFHSRSPIAFDYAFYLLNVLYYRALLWSSDLYIIIYYKHCRTRPIIVRIVRRRR